MTIWDKIAVSRPATKTAAIVAGGRGEHWESSRKPMPGQIRQFFPPDTRPVEHGTPDLKGRRFGRLVVYGRHAHNNSWVVRCDCGAFETRRHRTLTRGKVDPARMCSECEHIEQLKAGQARKARRS